MQGIYKITSPSGKIYIGLTLNYKGRLNHYDCLDCKGQPKLYNSFKKYGVDSHEFEFIEECEVDMLDEREVYWGTFYNVLDSEKGLNCKLGGQNISLMSEETKNKISQSNMGKNARPKGYKMSEESKQNIREKHLGTKHNMSLEGSKNISKTHLGNTYRLGDKDSPETLEKKRLAKVGITWSEETNNKRRKSMIGQNTTPIVCVNTGEVFSSQREAAKKFEMKERTINNLVRGVSKKSRSGLTFKYY